MTPADLKNWRKIMGLTQKQASALLGYTRPHYAHMEAGSVPIHPLLPMALIAHYHRLEPWPAQFGAQ